MMTASVTIDADLAARLISSQFPRWRHLPVRIVEPGGWDNRTFRLGEDMLIRMPSAACYAPQVEKEHQWLPRLRARLPVAIPEPLAMGRPDDDYPWNWSVYRWIDGMSATHDVVGSSVFAADLASFLTSLHQAAPADGPAAGAHNFQRGGPLSYYDTAFRQALTFIEPINRMAAVSVWERALEREWSSQPVWLHGDVSPSNLIVRDGRLAAVIDFGCLGVGDPACDLVMAWTFFDADSRRVFCEALPHDTPTWQRARGWALWKAAITLADAKALTQSEARHQILEILSDHVR